MAASFVNGSTTYLLKNSALVTAVPFTMGLWIYPTTTNFGALCSIGETALGQNYFWLCQGGSDFIIGASTPAGDEQATGGTVTPGTWHFVLGRFITATNRRMHILGADGTVMSLQSTISRVPSGIARTAIGTEASNPGRDVFTGWIAEYWLSDIDVWPGGGVIDAAFLRQLAWCGPWSVPRVAASIQEYRPLLQGISADVDVPGENFCRGAPPDWANVNGVGLVPHPPLAPGYIRPGQPNRLLVT